MHLNADKYNIIGTNLNTRGIGPQEFKLLAIDSLLKSFQEESIPNIN